MKWGLKKNAFIDKCFSINFLDDKVYIGLKNLTQNSGERIYEKFDDDLDIVRSPLLVAPIIGDIKKIRGVKTRIATILNPESKMVSTFKVLEEAMKKIETCSIMDEFMLIRFLSSIIRLTNTQYIKKYDMAYNCYIYATIDDDYFSFDSRISEKVWREDIEKINILLSKMGINEVINFSIDQFLNEGEVFDASMYWLNWNDLYY